MHSAILVEEPNSCESQDRQESQERSDSINPTSAKPPSASQQQHHHQQQQTSGTTTTTTTTTSSGYYDADKCRAYIANRIKVSKIDRFAAQVSHAIEVEASIQSRLGNILNMYVKHSAHVAHEFTFKCKLGLQRHRQDRILNQQRKPSKNKINPKQRGATKQYSINNDLLYGPGAQLVHTLLAPCSVLPFTKHIKRKTEGSLPGANLANSTRLHDDGSTTTDGHQDMESVACLERTGLSEDDYALSDTFEPAAFVKRLDEMIRINSRRSKAITVKLNTIRQLFERLAADHRDKVDLVYAAEEERQATTVIRRSAYNLSVAAIKATSTPVHVNSTS